MIDSNTYKALLNDDTDYLRLNLQLAAGTLKEKLKAFLSQFGITSQQYDILRIIQHANGEPLSTSELCTQMIDKKSDTSRMVDRLVAKGLVQKQPCPHDGRRIHVFLTNEGEYLLSTIYTKKRQQIGLLNSLSEKELDVLNQLLSTLHTC